GEAPQRDYAASPITGLDPALAKELGLGDEAELASPSPGGGGSREARGGVNPAEESSPPPEDLRSSTSPLQGEVKKESAERGLSTHGAPKADLPKPGSGLASMGVAATAESLDRLLREGRPELTQQVWTPHRPPRPEKSEGGVRLQIASDFEPKG